MCHDGQCHFLQPLVLCLPSPGPHLCLSHSDLFGCSGSFAFLSPQLLFPCIFLLFPSFLFYLLNVLLTCQNLSNWCVCRHDLLCSWNWWKLEYWLWLWCGGTSINQPTFEWCQRPCKHLLWLAEHRRFWMSLSEPCVIGLIVAKVVSILIPFLEKSKLTFRILGCWLVFVVLFSGCRRDGLKKE